MSKSYRQEQILKLIRSQAIHSQADLVAALRRAGIDATQVTLSRDLRELGLVKTPSGYAEMESEAGDGAAFPAELSRVIRSFVRDIRVAQNLLVIKTDPGAASSVGAAVDAEEWREMVGSLAGDDTLLLICESNRGCQQLEKRLHEIIEA